MNELEIERLALKLSGLTEAQGRRLARLLAEGLAAAPSAAIAPASLGTLRVRVRARPREPLGALSERIVDEVLRELQQTK